MGYRDPGHGETLGQAEEVRLAKKFKYPPPNLPKTISF